MPNSLVNVANQCSLVTAYVTNLKEYTSAVSADLGYFYRPTREDFLYPFLIYFFLAFEH